jgi:glycosyltransferase involved in cell wall biosynthesis
MPVVRLLGPAKQAGLEVIFGNHGPDVQPQKVAEGDVVVIQRDFPRFTAAYAEIITEAHAQAKPVIYETDDLLLALPSEHSSRRDISDVLLPILWAIVEADLVTTSTAFLRDYLKPFNANVQILPNLLNDQLWSLREISQDSQAGGPVCIGYMGGQSHLPDLIAVQPALESILDAYPGRVRFKFWGVRPPDEIIQRPEVEWIPLDLRDYAGFARYFCQQTCDIFIAPLEDNLFNRAKSALKFLEYSALGVPGVFSHIPAYAEAISNGQNGFLATDHHSWQTALSSLLDSPKLRWDMGLAAQKTVKEHWLLSGNAEQWRQAYEHAGQVARSPHPQRLERVQAVRRAATQIQIRHHELEAENQQLRIELEAYTALAAHRFAQLEEIHQSRSWKLLQKLNRLRHRLGGPG